jgi:hypothetical protein
MASRYGLLSEIESTIPIKAVMQAAGKHKKESSTEKVGERGFGMQIRGGQEPETTEMLRQAQHDNRYCNHSCAFVRICWQGAAEYL